MYLQVTLINQTLNTIGDIEMKAEFTKEGCIKITAQNYAESIAMEYLISVKAEKYGLSSVIITDQGADDIIHNPHYQIITDKKE